ncbi:MULTISPECIES: hypothetical protein [unclassified Microcoleus]|uniref:hypothetical protein n=1 Tax=unclassified Microcoleus TaxID=2642155 RepID=UPI002FD6CF8B
MPVPQNKDRQDACSTKQEQASCLFHKTRTGKMPVPQRVNFLVERAGEPVHKKLIKS